MSAQNTLKSLGFNTKEISLYLTLLKSGKMTATELAQKTKINRATVYSTASTLKARGVITEDTSDSARYFIPLPPENLKEIINKPMRELKEKAKVVNIAITELSSLAAEKEYPVPKMRFVEEQDMENFFYENIAKWQKSLREVDSTWWGIEDETYIKEFKTFFKWYWEHPAISDGVKIRLIANDSPEEHMMMNTAEKDMREVFFADDMHFTSSIRAGGDYLLLVNTRTHPYYMVEIYDKALASNMREVFKKLWKVYKDKK